MLWFHHARFQSSQVTCLQGDGSPPLAPGFIKPQEPFVGGSLRSETTPTQPCQSRHLVRAPFQWGEWKLGVSFFLCFSPLLILSESVIKSLAAAFILAHFWSWRTPDGLALSSSAELYTPGFRMLKVNTSAWPAGPTWSEVCLSPQPHFIKTASLTQYSSHVGFLSVP